MRVRSYFGILPLIVLALAAGCDAAPTGPTASEITAVEVRAGSVVDIQEHYREIVGSVTNECTGDEFSVVMDFHAVRGVTRPPNGAENWFLHLNIMATVTDPTTGAVYSGPQVLQRNQVLGEVFVESYVLVFNLVEHGAGIAESYRLVTHVTITPDWNVHADFYKLELSCR